MANVWTTAFKICGLLQLSLVTVTLGTCSDFAAISVHTPSLQGEDVFRLRRLADGFDHPSEMNFSKEMFSRFIRCLGTTSSTSPCIISVSFSSIQNQLFIYLATVGQIGIVNDNFCEQGQCGKVECSLPDTFITSRGISCMKQVNSKECFNSSNICSSLTLQNNGAFRTVYNVIWRSRGELTFSYNTSIVRVSSCGSTDTSISAEDSDNTATIAGVVCAILIIAVILVVVAVIHWRRKKASAGKGLRHGEGTSSSVAPAAIDQTELSTENVEAPVSGNAHSTVEENYNYSPYEQIDTRDADYNAVHTDEAENKDKNKMHGHYKNISKTDDSVPSITDTLDTTSVNLCEDTSGSHSQAMLVRTSNQNEGHNAAHPIKYYNTLQTGEKPVQNFKVEERPESACVSVAKDRNKTYYNELNEDVRATEADDGGSKGRAHNYYNFILENGDDSTN